MKPKIIVSVINDLVTDNRVNRTCLALEEKGYEVLLVGRKMKNSQPLDSRTYTTKRMKLLFEKGPLFYATFNIRLFFLLLFKSTDAYFSNDLDTLLPNLLVSKLKGKKLYYDAHEYFTEVPELVSRPKVQKIWKTVEQFCLKRVDVLCTVNESIASLYREKYAVKTFVVRNVPLLDVAIVDQLEKRENILILQGAGINIDRGGEELMEAMQYIEGAKLWVIGSGDAIPQLKEMQKELGLQDKVEFKGKLPLGELKTLTRKGIIGYSLDKNTNVNYQFSLPNKLFDYLQAQVAVIVSPLVEVKKIVEQYNVGVVLEEVSAEEIANKTNDLLLNYSKLEEIRNNTINAAKELHWDKEKEVFFEFLDYR